MKVDILLCCQPINVYFAWQVEVMLNNFYVVELPFWSEIHIVWAIDKSKPDYAKNLELVKKIEAKFKLVKFYYYEDTRILKNYLSSIRPHCLAKHWKANPSDIKSKIVFYHDCDMIFTKHPKFFYEDLNIDDYSWLVSNTQSYIGYNYIKNIDHNLINIMFPIIGLHPQVAIDKEEQSGGCQYILHSVNWLFWHKVELDCEIMFKEVTDYNNQKISENKDYKPIQIWCADMWCVLWNAWALGLDTIIDERLKFTWAKDSIKLYDSAYIFHNSGVVKSDAETIFYKQNFNELLPYNKQLAKRYSKEICQNKYLQLIDKVGETSVLNTK